MKMSEIFSAIATPMYSTGCSTDLVVASLLAMRARERVQPQYRLWIVGLQNGGALDGENLFLVDRREAYSLQVAQHTGDCNGRRQHYEKGPESWPARTTCPLEPRHEWGVDRLFDCGAETLAGWLPQVIEFIVKRCRLLTASGTSWQYNDVLGPFVGHPPRSSAADSIYFTNKKDHKAPHLDYTNY
ncbi:predicted protein [Aspergillus terreus NIH2624]|uniref:Uncharacterized protein n=1 Tax=Aspergillus terreus (strain NIH 2624 / FGSC A1156) TaxID=341663 RepID=Q0CBA7_ASPTN|nr:uncharacterized protein ATEG_09027 [Aspergillus terreus NIH2624]EAU30164.1 predicted protein [Aspergillus terreus NIH2624]